MHVCMKLSYEQVLPALPPLSHGGSIDVLKFVGPVTRDLLMHPEKLVVEDVGQNFPKLQGKVHVVGDDLGRISDQLVERGVCKWIPKSMVVKMRGQMVLNGLFGVPKNSSTGSGLPVLRLIMNLVPSNSILQQIRGKVNSLPHITGWLSTFIDEGQELRLWQSDMSNAFYLFKIPDVWCPYLAFNVSRAADDLLGVESEEEHYLACSVLPMGWASSVGIMQEVSERILLDHGVPRESQLRRGRAIPPWMVGILATAHTESRAWWHVYLDNFAAGEVLEKRSPNAGDQLHCLAEEAWKNAGVISSEKKRQRFQLQAEELGAYFDGEQKWMGGSRERMLKLIQATLWLLQRRQISRRLVQVVVGRWIHVFQFRRPAMCMLSLVWDFISGKGLDQTLVQKVRRELFCCVCMVPLLHTYLGSEPTGVITASDASSKGGAVGISPELTITGRDYLAYSLAGGHGRPVGILVVSLFNGIGGAFRCYDLLGLTPIGLIAFDTHKPANRVTSRNGRVLKFTGM